MGNRNEVTVQEKKQELKQELEKIEEEAPFGGPSGSPDRIIELEAKIETLRWVQGLENDLIR